MKLFKKIRKGFTLIELVVVIAVIAILSAVAVVSYISITNKAKRSSDEQAVAQMNTILKANDIMGLNTIKDVFAAFSESGLDAKNYKPLSKDTYFFWDADANKIIYVDKTYTVLYPNELKGQTKGADSHWLSLSGEIQQRDYSNDVTVVDGKTTIDVKGTATEAGEKLYKLSEDIKQGEYKVSGADSQTIELPKNVDLAGSEFNLGTAQNLTLKGESSDNKTTIDNVFTSEYQSKGTSADRKTRSYHVGMVQEVKGTVTFENLIIKNVTIGDYSISMSAIFAGKVASDGHLIVKNCVIEDAYIYGEQKVAAIAGYMDGGDVTIENCTFKNVHILSEEGCAAAVSGLVEVGKGSKITADASSIESMKANVESSLTKVADRHYYAAPVTSLEDGSNEVVSTFKSYSDRTGETRQKSSTSEAKERCKPGCATFGWVNGGDKENGLYFEDKDFMVSYHLIPIHASDMAAE